VLFRSPGLAHGLAHRGLPLVIASALAGLAALVLLWRGWFTAARGAAAAAVTAVLWGWALAQYPYLLRGRLTIAAAAAQHSVLMATLICLAIGAVLLIPSLTWLYVLFQRSGPGPSHRVADGG